MATESNRDKTRRGGWGTGEVLSVGAVAVDHASGPDFTGRTVHVAGAPSCNQTLTIGVDGQRIAVPLSASDTAAVAAGKIAAALGPRYEARGSTVVERPVPNASRPTDRLAGIRAAFAPGPPARVGFTCPPLGLGESAILRLDNTGPEPVAGMSRDGGQTWEDAPREPAPLDVLPGVVVMSAWRRPDGALVAEGSDGVDRVTKPGEIRTPEDADRLFGVGFGLGRWMRANKGAAVLDVAPALAAQPDPAPGQVWLPPVGDYTPGQLDADGTLTIAVADGDTLRFGGRQANARIGTKALRNGGGWTCIGVATPHGRVAIGDAFRPDADAPEWTVSAVGYPPGTVVLSGSAGSCSNDAAHVAARWQRTRYAPARAGERYRDRRNGDVKSIGPGAHEIALPLSAHGGMDPAQWERIDAAAAPVPAALPSLTRDGWTAEVRSNAITPGDNGARFVMHVTSPSGHTFAGPFDQWNVVVPGAKPQSAAELADFLGFCMAGVEAEGQSPRDGQTIRFKRPVSVVEAERARVAGETTATPERQPSESVSAYRVRCADWLRAQQQRTRDSASLLTATGADLDALAGLYGVGKRGVCESDEAYRARCVGAMQEHDGADPALIVHNQLAEAAALANEVHAQMREPIRFRFTFTTKPGAPATLTLRAPARDLRALFDAIGRALESAAPEIVTFGGKPLSVLRSDGCAEPSVHAGTIDANARDLCVLRASVAQALTDGRSYACAWDKGRTLTVERVGGPLVTAQPAPAEPQATHYDGAQGGPDAWRWEVGE